MSPAIGILGWVIIGALAGFIGSKLLDTDRRQSAVATVAVGVIGAIVGGFVTQRVFGDDPGNNGLITSFAVALFGSCMVILGWKAFARRNA